jgi:hypothetical protein
MKWAPLSLLLLASNAWADELDCSDFFARLGITPEQSEAMYLRRASATPIDAVYKNNMMRVGRSFENFLEQKEPLGDFTAWLADQHKLSVMGEKPGTFYWPEVGRTRSGGTIPSNIVIAEGGAGSYRHFRPDPPADRWLTQELPMSAETLAEIKRLAGDRKPVAVMNSGIPSMYHIPNIDGIPKEALPRYTISMDKVKFDYPPSKFVPQYLREMGASMERVRGLMQAPNRNTDSVLKELGHYYHLIMVGHPFMRVNNSMAMAQINVALRKLGMKPVLHGDLDYVVRGLDSNAARDAFVEFVKKGQ